MSEAGTLSVNKDRTVRSLVAKRKRFPVVKQRRFCPSTHETTLMVFALQFSPPTDFNGRAAGEHVDVFDSFPYDEHSHGGGDCDGGSFQSWNHLNDDDKQPTGVVRASSEGSNPFHPMGQQSLADTDDVTGTTQLSFGTSMGSSVATASGVQVSPLITLSELPPTSSR
jgi:hypothetical protein